MFEKITSEKQNYIAKGLIAFLVVVTAFFLLKGINEIKRNASIGEDPSKQHTIHVSGEGEVFTVPDTAEFTFTVQQEAESVAQAQESVTQRANTITQYLKDKDIAEEDIKTVGYNINPRYEYRDEVDIRPPEGRRVLVGYEVSQRTRVKVTDTSKVGTLLGGIGEQGVSEVSNVSFTVEDEQQVKDEARAQAIQDAKEKAQALADQLGVRLGDVVDFNQSHDQPRYLMDKASARENDDAAGGATPDISPGQNRIVSNVNITYEIQ